MVNKDNVGRKLFELRKRKGITQEKLASLVNVTPQAISKWENSMALPDTYLLPTLANLFHVSIEELLCTESEYNKENQKADRHQILLHGLKYYPSTPPLVGCIKSSLDYIGIHVSTGWISAPYAFMLNINHEVSSMGPEFWSDNGCYENLIRNCGGIHVYFSGHKSDENISEKRKEAWNMIRDSIDKGLPCYAWEMDKPLYYLIAGYDDIGYYYIEHNSREIAGPKPYNELGNTEWGILEIHIIRPGSISDSLKTIKDIFEYAINVSNPDYYPPNEGYTRGVNAYRTWWEALLNGTADYYGVAYNAAFWAKCKRLAALFLQESKLRIEIEERHFNHAINYYQNTANSLYQLIKLFPLGGTANEISEEQKNDAVNLLKIAYRNETDGLSAISNILDAIYQIW